MKTYARIDGGIVAELFATDGDITTMFHPDLFWKDVTNVSPAPQEGWSAEETDGAWSFVAQAIQEPPIDVLAREALDISDTTVLRCYEHAVGVPAEWQEYRSELRAIVSGSSSAETLPTRPAFPAGT